MAKKTDTLEGKVTGDAANEAAFTEALKSKTQAAGLKSAQAALNGAGTAKATGDVTKAAQATSKEDVDAQDSRTRLWQSLGTTYGQAIEESDKQYDLNKGEADRAAIARGMGRSSYNLATLANIDTQKAQAADRLRQQQIADYQKGVSELEQQEKEDEKFWEQFKYQQGRDKVADDQWKQQFVYQQGRDAKADEQWDKQYEQGQKSSEQQVAMSFVSQILAAGGTPSDTLLQQAGLSRQDYEAMKQQAAATGGPSSGGKKPWEILGISQEQYERLIAGDEKPTTDPRATRIAMSLGLMSPGGGGSSKPSYYSTLTTK
jgi:hypothetical protein